MKKIFAFLVLSVVMCATGTSVFAQEREEKSEAQHEETAFQVVSRLANFVVLFGGLAFLLRKPMGEFFATRRGDISSGLQRAQDAQADAQNRMDEIEQRLAHLSADVSALRSEAEREALTEREKILAEAKRDVERIVEQSKQEIDRIARTVEREIKENIADLVIDRAGNTLRSEITQDDQKRIVVRFIKTL